jgi:DNA adenine methylase
MIQCRIFKSILHAEANDFVYLDPLYKPISRTSNFTVYTHQGFDNDDQLKLKKTFMELNHRNCKVLLSNSFIYSNFRIKEVDVEGQGFKARML